jgi:hypothetical protein
MVQQVSVQYPFGITVVAKTTINAKNENDLLAGTSNAFQIWLKKNYVDNPSLNCGMSLLDYDKETWEEKAPRCGVTHSYDECMNSLEIFQGKIIEVIVGM